MSSPRADAEPKPSIYLFYGDDAFSIGAAIRSLIDHYPDRTTADLNVERFEGPSLNLGTLEEVATSAPFLADRRLVVVNQVGQLIKRKDDRDRLLHLLPKVPPTTALILIDRLDLSRRTALRNYKDRSPLYRWVTTGEHRSRALAKAFVQPHGSAFVQWIREHCGELGGEIEPRAAQLLAEAVADDPHLAHQELRKLLNYVDRGRPIETEDVRRLTPLYGQPDIFAMVDAIGARDAPQALAHLHELLQDEDPRYAFVMIVRQFRLILQAREALDERRQPADAMQGHPYVLRKVTQQARNFQLDQLEGLYQELLELDVDSKLGRADLATAMDQLILRLAA